MKLYYFYQVGFEEKGIIKKIKFQEKALKKNGINLKKTNVQKDELNKKYIFYFEKEILGAESYRKLSVLKKRIFEKKKIYEKIIEKMKKNKVTYIYIRYYRADFVFLNFLKKLKKEKINIIFEIPTYPYDCEVKKINFSLILDKLYRQHMDKYVNKIVTYSEDKEIWGIPCINISNGIDLEEVKMIDKKNKEKNKIVFTSVSNCSFWHGIDRLLCSLEEYGKLKDKKEIQFNIVGEGSESDKLKEIVARSEYLSKVVLFQGFKIGKDLDNIYDETDIGIGSLARHRSGLETMRALKNREYCAKGLPMIFSEDDPDLRDVPFVYHISADEQLIDIESVIKWYQNMNLKPEEIRKYSEQFSWDIQMKKVIDEIEK